MKKIILSLKGLVVRLFNAAINFPKRVLSTVLLFFSTWYAFYVFVILNQVTITGRRNIPKKSNILYVAVHKTFIDSFVIGLSIVNILDFLFNYQRIPWNAASSEFWFNNKFKRFLFGLLKCKPTIRKTSSRPALEKSIRELAAILQKESLLLFFEGSRERTKEIGGCKPGVAMLIRLLNPITVVPIFLEGIEDILPVRPDGKKLNLHDIKSGKKVKVIIGKPIDFTDIPIINFNLDNAIKTKGALPPEIYQDCELEIIKKRVRSSVAELNPQKEHIKTD